MHTFSIICFITLAAYGHRFALIVIAVNILTKKRDFSDSIVSQVANLIKDGCCRPIPFTTPYKWYYTEAAHVIAATHNADPGIEAVLIVPDRQYICISFILTQLHIHGVLTLFTFEVEHTQKPW